MKKLIGRDKVFVLCHKKMTVGLFIIKIVVYTLLQGTRTGAVVMTKVKTVMDCV